MTIQGVDFLPAGARLVETARASAGTAADFAYWMEREVGEVNDKLLHADQLVRKLALGEVDNVHQVMIALDQARLSFQLVSQVRNRLLESYQDVLRMAV
jgi:flagellar hook-basal body complex protein FliE